MFGMIESVIDFWTDLIFPPPPPSKIEVATVPEPKGDGRCFAWVRVRGLGGYNPIYPCILLDPSVGPPLTIYGGMHPMKPREYGLSITELAALYPAPKGESQ